MQATDVHCLDSETCLIYLEVPGAKVVLLQAFFELYEGLGTVRTIDIKKSQVCIITTPSFVSDCMMVLEELKYQVPWRTVEKPDGYDPLALFSFGS